MGQLTVRKSFDTNPAIPAVAAITAKDVHDGEVYGALPGFDLVNQAIIALKGSLQDGQRGCSCKKICAYLGYRLISYSCIPLALNLVSLILSGVLTLLTLPLRCCKTEINRWCCVKFQGSLGYTLQSLFDLTCDFRLLTGTCCCPPESLYLQV